MEIFYVAVFFILGAIIGSFLNVVLLRHGTGRSVQGRSGCMSCAKKLSWYELIPILSWCAQYGRCRGCGSRVSKQYPIVELLTGVVFVYGYFVVSSQLVALPILLVMLATLVLITVYDIKHMIIPDKWSALFAVLSLIFATMYWFESPLDIFITQAGIVHLLAGPILFIPFWLLWYVSKGAWIGLGDAKLAVGIGWLLGLIYGITAIVISFWIGAAVGVALLLISHLVNRSGRITMKSEIPFGPFLVLGTLIILYFQMNIVEITNLFI